MPWQLRIDTGSSPVTLQQPLDNAEGRLLHASAGGCSTCGLGGIQELPAGHRPAGAIQASLICHCTLQLVLLLFNHVVSHM